MTSIDDDILRLQEKLVTAIRLDSTKQLELIYAKLVDAFVQKKEFDVAIGFAQKQLEIVHLTQDVRSQNRVLCNLGKICHQITQVEASIVWLKKALSAAMKLHDPEVLAMTHWNLALAYQAEGNSHENLFLHVNETEHFLAKSEKTSATATLEIHAKLLRATYFKLNQKKEEQQQELLESERLAQGSENPQHKFVVNNALGLFYYQTGNLDQSLEYFENNLDLMDDHPFSLEDRQMAYHHAANVSFALERFSEARQYHELAIARDPRSVASQDMNVLAMCQLELLAQYDQDWDQASLWHAQVEAENQDSGSKHSMLCVYQSLQCFLQEKHERAIEILEQTLDYAADKQNQVMLDICHRNLGQLHNYLGNTRQATEHFQTNIERATVANNDLEVAMNYGGLGQVQAAAVNPAEDDIKAMISSFQTQHQLLQDLGPDYLHLQALALWNLATTYTKLGNFLEAIVAFERTLAEAEKVQDEALIVDTLVQYAHVLSCQMSAEKESDTAVQLLEQKRDQACARFRQLSSGWTFMNEAVAKIPYYPSGFTILNEQKIEKAEQEKE